MKKVKRLILILIVTVLVSVAVVSILVGNQIRTVASAEKVAEGLYKISYYADYKLEDMCDADVGTIAELENWMSENMFFGYPVSGRGSGFGCSAFLAEGPNGDYLLGRNYDYNKTETLIVFTSPKNGYKSYAIADMNMLGVGGNNSVTGEDLYGKLSMLASPYAITEGLNEKGLGAAILKLETDEIHQDNGKPDILLFVAVRMILDKAADTNEAVALLSDYDIHSFFGSSFHLFIADASGKSVVVEWVDGQISVVDAEYVTNFQLSEGKDYGYGLGQARYEILKNKFEKTNGKLTAEESISLLSDAMIPWNGKWGTEWSVVMNLTDFEMDVCIDGDYNHVYNFSEDDF